MSGNTPQQNPGNLTFRAHPWHGVPLGENFPERVTAYIEMVQSDNMKFELDKETGILRIDRPQRFSTRCPAPYGLIPQTLCASRVASFCMSKTNRQEVAGDGDPLDICVLCESDINHGNVLLNARPIGGLRMIDGNEADDKIIAVLDCDLAYEAVEDIADLPTKLVDRLRHYFLTYKEIPGGAPPCTEITHVFNRAEALEIIRLSHEDYCEAFPSLPQRT